MGNTLEFFGIKCSEWTEEQLKTAENLLTLKANPNPPGGFVNLADAMIATMALDFVKKEIRALKFAEEIATDLVIGDLEAKAKKDSGAK